MTTAILQDPARSQRLDGIFAGMSEAICPLGTRHISSEWEDEDGNLVGYLFVSGLYQRIEFDADMTLSDQQLAQRMADAARPIALERLGLDQAKERLPFTEVLRIHDLHRQLLANAGVDLASYLDRIGNEKYVHHDPSYSNSDYFTVPSLNGDMERLPQGLGDAVSDKNGRLNLTLSLTLSDAVTLDIGATHTEFRITGQLPHVVSDTLEGGDFFDVIEVEALAGAKAMVTKVDRSPAAQMRPEMHYVQVEHAMRYVHDPIWDKQLEQQYDQRLSDWVKSKR